ncbi:YbhB/YbcL family Raf kinase inhibitor-like protein [Nocardia sp. CDC159]|uniref:YbhB/YbcL family Raf kinase inhibitor-like protein n=1 Tax=Nocardia pulmonis TaxID=2951408 RepID=A0A9X2E948_9NOCA|nr:MULTISPECIES: YbhB/YbcL family Raf kinase inhibitor-like protein [Nocardia]MCM6775233.1 YbhB/YbcL family Raf kinase inhibitor-like protein [Nocardia pulmonis]MCM6788033.1 YbhB/YbcL family Raf kinase inhibitor-like protein [Nocardia sp. CDC159]
MSSRRVRLVAAAVLTLAATAGCSDSGSTPPSTTTTTAADPPATHQIRVTSSAVVDGAALPDEYTCAKGGRVLPLSWTTPPETARFALIVDDPDAADGGFTHWVIIDIPATITEISGSGTLVDGTVLTNSAGRADYAVPCPPPDTGIHHYRFTVHALPNRLSLPWETPPDQARTSIEQASIAQGSLTATYSR